jgi:hypothetical protein
MKESFRLWQSKSIYFTKDNVRAVSDNTSNGLLSPSTELVNDDTQRQV